MSSTRGNSPAGLDDRDEDLDSNEDNAGSGTTTRRNKRKKSAAQDEEDNSSTRKEQNRMSQRESRQRKAIHVRTLEAQIRMMSLDKDDRLQALLISIGVIIDENVKLRQLLGNVVGFIGEDLEGGLLAKRGVAIKDVVAAVEREDKTWMFSMADDISARVQNKKAPPAPGPTTSTAQQNGSASTRSPSTTDSTSKTVPTASIQRPPAFATDIGTSDFSQPTYSQGPSPDIFADFLQIPPMFQGMNTSEQLQQVPVASTSTGDGEMSFLSATSPWPGQNQAASTPSDGQLPGTSSILETQASQLINFHLRSRAENPFHVLPPALEPTFLQTMLPHDPSISSILWPSIRDKLISSQNSQAALQPRQVVEDLLANTSVHPGLDLLDPSTWELSEFFIKRYPSLIDASIIGSTNKWRLSRGEREIVL